MSVDALTATYRLPCPEGGTSRVRLSSFREIERLPGPSHPALYRIVYRCSCGGDHVALVGHDELDWSPLGLDGGVTYVNLMTSRYDDLSVELTELASQRIGRGEWPWSFFCYLEDVPRPVTPSAFRVLEQSVETVAVAVGCPACGSTTINLVSRLHVDVPFHSDANVGVVAHVFEEAELSSPDALRAELGAADVDARRLVLHG